MFASIDVTDQSVGRGRSFRDHEYLRRSWVRFLPGEARERLNARVLDALKQMNPGGPGGGGGKLNQAAPADVR